MRTKGTARLRHAPRQRLSVVLLYLDPAARAEPPEPEAENDERNPENDCEGADQPGQGEEPAPGKTARITPKSTESEPRVS